MNTSGIPRFGSASFYKEALSIAIPVMVQNLVMGLVSLVDNFMVAALGDAKMAGVNVANQINFIYLVVMNTVCLAGGIYLSQHRGAKDRAGMQQAFRFKLLVAEGLSLLYLVGILLFAEPLVALMRGNKGEVDEIVRQGAIYLRTVSPSVIFIGISSALATSFRDIGLTKVPLLVSITAALVNTFFNWVLIYGNLGAPRLEVSGAAIATIIARGVECATFLAMLKRKKPDFAFPSQTIFHLDKGLFGAILGKSGMMLFSETAWVMSETIITALYNGRGGAETVAGMAAGWTIANIIFLVFPAIGASTGVIVGATLGSGRLDEGRAKARWIMSGAVILGIGAGLFAFAGTALIPLVFANLSAQAQTVTRSLVFVIGVYLPIWCLLNAQFAVSRAGGDTLLGIWIDVAINYVFFIPTALLIAAKTPWGPVLLFGIAKLYDLPKAAIAGWWLKKERWVRNLAVKEDVT